MPDVSHIKRWLNQRCIGYQRTGYGFIERSIMEGQVELDNGTIRTAWTIEEPGPNESYNPMEKTTFSKPRIDQDA